MTEISVTTRRGDPSATEADTRIVGLFEGEALEDERLQRLVDAGEAKGALKKVAVAHEDVEAGNAPRTVIIAGLGKRDELDAEKARVAAATAAGRARELGSRSLSWKIPESDGVVGPLVEGTLLRLYEFDRYKSKSGDEEDSPPEIASLELVSERIPEGVDIEGEAERARGVGGGELRPRPAELAGQRGHADLPGRARARWPTPTKALGRDLDRAGIESLGMGRSPRSPRAPTRSRS
ncbi:MAG: M17 family peptidase N-terminal domain-containing protein [Thermoleophilaceae bacterium]